MLLSAVRAGMTESDDSATFCCFVRNRGKTGLNLSLNPRNVIKSQVKTVKSCSKPRVNRQVTGNNAGMR